MRTGNRLLVSEVSRALLHSYGGRLTCVCLHEVEGGTASGLTALLRRQKKLRTIVAVGQKTFVGLFQSIAQGLCRGVECITLEKRSGEVDEECLDILAETIQIDGALPALNTFFVDFEDSFYSDTPLLPKLARALMRGALPLLEHLRVQQGRVTKEDLNVVADIVEARAGIPNCHRLQTFDTNSTSSGGSWIDLASPNTQIRLLRALLPSLKDLERFKWGAASDSCFCDVRPQYLEALRVSLISWAPAYEVLEAAPALKVIDYCSSDAAAFQPITDVLRRGVGLHHLQEVNLSLCALGDEHFRDFMEALEDGGYAERIITLSFYDCEIGVEGARSLAGLLHRDGLRALENLCFSKNNIQDEGIVAVAGALRNAPRTSLRELELPDIGMGDTGMADLAAIVYRGRMRHIQKLNLSGDGRRYNCFGTGD